MEVKPEEGSRVTNKRYGAGTVQPLFANLHPNFPEDMVYVKYDKWPTTVDGTKMGVDVLQTFIDELEPINT